MLTPPQKKYLAQVYNIAPDYAQGIFDAMPSDRVKFPFSEVEELSKDAHLWYKEKKFRPSMGERLTGYAPPQAIYNY